MKKLFATLFLLLTGPAYAGVTCSLPFNLQNGTTADATQVMANYNALVTCLGNAAAAGANNDITSLNALSTPITPAQGGTPVYIGGTSTGSGNAQVVASTSPTGFTLVVGKQVTFKAGFSNTGATTLNVGGTGATNIFRRTQLGVSAMVGGEIVVGQVVNAIYDGTQFQMLGPTVLVGEGREWFGTTAPTGWFLRDGTSLVRTDYPDLFTVIGTIYGAADGSHFSLPDERGRVAVGVDTGVGRIVSACSGSVTLGTGCGNTNGQASLSQANLPSVNFTVTDPGHLHGITNPAQASGAYTAGGTPSGTTTGSATTQSATTGISVASGGSSTPFNTVDPSLIVNKIIKY